MSQLLTLGQVCERVQLSPWAVRRAIHRGELRAHKLGGRLRIAQAALEDWVQASLVEPEQAVALEPRQRVATDIPSARETFRARLRKVSPE